MMPSGSWSNGAKPGKETKTGWLGGGKCTNTSGESYPKIRIPLIKLFISGRKKRDANELQYGVRRPRAAGPDLVISREFECVQTGNKGYWKYDYTIPDKCYSKQTEIRGHSLNVSYSHSSYQLHPARPGEHRSQQS